MTTRISRRSVLRTLGAGALGAAVVGSGSVASKPGVGSPETLFEYDPDIGEFPENVAVDRRGTKYVSFPPLGEIRYITPDNTTEEVLTTFDAGSGVGVIGLEVDPQGTLYACLDAEGGADERGVYRVDSDGTKTLLAGFGPGTLPNDIALDGHSLLVTETIGGGVYRVNEDGKELWVEDDLLKGTGSVGFGFEIGANGIARLKDGSVVVANTEKGTLVRIPVAPDGSAGTPEVFASAPELGLSDGIAVDTRDNVYVGVVGQDTVVRVAPGGSVEALATAADGLDGPSDVTFGTSRGEQKTLFITNFALLNTVDPAPSLMKLDVGVPGAPIHR